MPLRLEPSLLTYGNCTPGRLSPGAGGRDKPYSITKSVSCSVLRPSADSVVPWVSGFQDSTEWRMPLESVKSVGVGIVGHALSRWALIVTIRLADPWCILTVVEVDFPVEDFPTGSVKFPVSAMIWLDAR